MIDLLDPALGAHGGVERWRGFSRVRATMAGGFPAGRPIRDRLMVSIDLSDIEFE